MMKKIRENKGFTLAELLIVVAIIAVLVAVAIPVFTAQLEKAAEATDIANIRSAYAEVVVSAMENTTLTKTVTKQQSKDGWEASNSSAKIGDTAITDIDADGGSGTITVSYTKDADTITLGGATVDLD